MVSPITTCGGAAAGLLQTSPRGIPLCYSNDFGFSDLLLGYVIPALAVILGIGVVLGMAWGWYCRGFGRRKLSVSLLPIFVFGVLLSDIFVFVWLFHGLWYDFEYAIWALVPNSILVAIGIGLGVVLTGRRKVQN